MNDAIEDIIREKEAMIARSRRGIAKDDSKTPEDWGASLRSVLDGADVSERNARRVLAKLSFRGEVHSAGTRRKLYAALEVT